MLRDGTGTWDNEMTGAVVLVELEPPAVIVCMAPVVAAAVSEIKAIKTSKTITENLYQK